MGNDASYIIAGRRSPIGKFLGSLSRLSPTDVGGRVAIALLADAKVNAADIDEVFVGQVLQAGCGQNPARQVALAAGCPDTVSACTVNKVCGSGLQAAMFADQVIRAGDANLVLAGGIESMSGAPFLSREMRGGKKFGDAKLVDCMLYDGLTNVYDGDVMGLIAEETADKAGITRRMQDEFAVESHQKAAKAAADGCFDAELVAIEVRKGKPAFDADETVRSDADLNALAGLRSPFKEDGSVTAGNASQISDSAAMLLLASEQGLAKTTAKPLARVAGIATAGGPPRELFFAPIQACRMVCERAGWPLDTVDLWELNEAFACQALACLKGLEIDPQRVNVHGGAIALGHPIGASGARVLVTLLHAMKRRSAKRGVASLCLGGGNAVAMAVETA